MIDPRAHSDEKLLPPAPLPHVSRSALKRVKDWVSPPTACPYCRGPVKLVCNDEIYGQPYGCWPYAYRCEPCNAHVGLHPDTDLPLGILANGQLRKWRKIAKDAFHDMLCARGIDRNEGYTWLSEMMGIPRSECHFGMFDIDRCEKATDICIDWYKAKPPAEKGRSLRDKLLGWRRNKVQ